MLQVHPSEAVERGKNRGARQQSFTSTSTRVDAERASSSLIPVVRCFSTFARSYQNMLTKQKNIHETTMSFSARRRSSRHSDEEQPNSQQQRPPRTTHQTTCKDLNLTGNTLCCGCSLREDQPESKYKNSKCKCKRLWSREHRQVQEGKRGKSQQWLSHANSWRQLIAMGHPESTGWAELIESKPERNAGLPPTSLPARPPPPPPEQQDGIDRQLTNPTTQKRARPGSPAAISPSKKSKTATPCMEQIEECFAKITPTE
jgi:hypothetical protein